MLVSSSNKQYISKVFTSEEAIGTSRNRDILLCIDNKYTLLNFIVIIYIMKSLQQICYS